MIYFRKGTVAHYLTPWLQPGELWVTVDTH